MTKLSALKYPEIVIGVTIWSIGQNAYAALYDITSIPATFIELV
jgi:hypothetical protein